MYKEGDYVSCIYLDTLSTSYNLGYLIGMTGKLIRISDMEFPYGVDVAGMIRYFGDGNLDFITVEIL